MTTETRTGNRARGAGGLESRSVGRFASLGYERLGSMDPVRLDRKRRGA